jgi:hypothetical protein
MHDTADDFWVGGLQGASALKAAKAPNLAERIGLELKAYAHLIGAALIDTGSALYEQYGPWLRSWTARGGILMFLSNILPAIGWAPGDQAMAELATRLYLLLNALGFLFVIIGRGHAKGPLFGAPSLFPRAGGSGAPAAPGAAGAFREERLAALDAPAFDLAAHLRGIEIQARAPSDPIEPEPTPATPSPAPVSPPPARVPEPVAKKAIKTAPKRKAKRPTPRAARKAPPRKPTKAVRQAAARH